MLYNSTRGGETGLQASEAILKGLADDGGLFMPESLPKLSKSLKELSGMSYQDLAYEVMKEFLTDFTEEELRHCINSAYDEKFETPDIAPLVKKDDALSTIVNKYAPRSEELEESDLEFVSAARGQMSYEQFLQMAKEKTIKK